MALFGFRSLRYFEVGLLFAVLTASLSACAPMTKESYLTGYAEFMQEVASEGEHYTERDWQRREEEFTNYSEIWHARFKDELTFKEDLVIVKYGMQYNMYKFKYRVSGFFKDFDEEDYDALKEQIAYYVENDMESDLNALVSEAREVGDTAIVIVRDILDELDVEIEEMK